MIHRPDDGQIYGSNKDTGEMVQGNRQGPWIDRWAHDGFLDNRDPGRICISEGHYADGQKSGKWVVRCSDGSGGEETYVNGEQIAD